MQVHSVEERRPVNRLRESLEDELRSIALQRGTDFETLLRYARGIERTGEPVDDWSSEDEEYCVPRGAWLLPELRRLATP
jgi:hypothetical protein